MLAARLSERLYRLASPAALVCVTVLLGVFVGWIMPRAGDVGRIAGTGRALPLPFFRYLMYSPTDFYTALEAWGPDGRARFVDYRLLPDTLWLLTLGAFLALALSVALRAATPEGSRLRRLNLAGLLPSVLDLAENQLQNLLVLFHPARHDGLAVIAAGLTTLKWLSLLFAGTVLLFAIGRTALWRGRRR